MIERKKLSTIGQHKILVVGDVMLDTYFNGTIKRISPEAPVPVFSKESEYSVLGGAANVAANLVAAGQSVDIATIVGKDEKGRMLRNTFRKQDINVELMISLDRTTTEKIRFLTSNNQQVLRLDVEETSPLPEDTCKVLLKLIEERIDEFDLILLSDYLKGLFTYEFTQGVLQLARKKDIPAIVDVKDSEVRKYKDAYLLKPNLKELHELTGEPVNNDEEIIRAAEQLKILCNCRYILTTCGAGGMVLVGDDEPYFVEAEGQEVYDVTGAGDTAIAYLAACMVNGFCMKDSVDIANVAAGIQVSKVGTSSIYWREVREYLSDNAKGFIHKIISGDAVDNFREEHKREKVVFTNGCFDIMHIGHMRYLYEASKLGDILIVGLNSDMSVKRLKGEDRPINCEFDRAEMMCALEFIDYVAIFEEDTPLELIKKIQPDVLVKGGDYANQYVVGTKEVESSGGKLVLIPFVEGKSTTNIIKKIKL